MTRTITQWKIAAIGSVVNDIDLGVEREHALVESTRAFAPSFSRTTFEQADFGDAQSRRSCA
jgi:hypothetical protein